ncbi:MAG: single-stranded DNA-binding protein [Proteobacteria bacterium]|nr:single-stranded DNA-binding protein [Pseudomonadota bacterium]
MRCYNRTTVIGHVGHDVVVRYTQAGKPVVNLRIATSERRKDGSEVTTWHRAVLWDRLAEIAHKHVRKGMPLYIEGPLHNKPWTDKEGNQRNQMEISARELIMLGGRGRPEGVSGARVIEPGQRARDGEEITEVVEDIPF